MDNTSIFIFILHTLVGHQTSSQNIEYEEGCRYDGIPITLECPDDQVINILSSDIFRTLGLGYCNRNYGPRCRLPLQQGDDHLTELSEQCDAHRTCSVPVLRGNCTENGFEWDTDMQSISYRCVNRNKINEAYGCTRALTSTLHLSCREGLVISIRNSRLGMTDSATCQSEICCPDKSPCWRDTDTNDQSDILDLQKRRCDGYESCSVDLVQYECQTNEGLGSDNGYFQYLYYSCVNISTVSKHVEACSHDGVPLTLVCPHGEIISILSSEISRSYGGEYCSKEEEPWCTLTFPGSDDLFSEQRRQCDGHRECSVDVLRKICWLSLSWWTTDMQSIHYKCVNRNNMRKSFSCTTGQSLQLECPAGLVIHISHSIIGKWSADCNDDCCIDPFWCHAQLEEEDTLLDSQRMQCNQQRTCKVSILEEPCMSTSGGYTDLQAIDYECVGSQTERHAYACAFENRTLVLQCEDNQLINVTQVVMGRGHLACPRNQCCPEDEQWSLGFTTEDPKDYFGWTKVYCLEMSVCSFEMADYSDATFQYVFYTCLPSQADTTKSSTLPSVSRGQSTDSSSEPEWPPSTQSPPIPVPSDGTATPLGSSTDPMTGAHNGNAASSSSNTGLIAGIVGGVGFLVILTVIIVLLIYLRRRHSKKSTSNEGLGPGLTSHQPSAQDDSHIYSQEMDIEHTERMPGGESGGGGLYEMETDLDTAPTANPSNYDYAYGNFGNNLQDGADGMNAGADVVYGNINPQNAVGGKEKPVAVVRSMQMAKQEDEGDVYSEVDKGKKTSGLKPKDEEVVTAENDMYASGDLRKVDHDPLYENQNVQLVNDKSEVTLAENDMYSATDLGTRDIYSKPQKQGDTDEDENNDFYVDDDDEDDDDDDDKEFVVPTQPYQSSDTKK